MSSEPLVIDGVNVGFIESSVTSSSLRIHESKGNICPFCDETYEKGQDIYLMISNYILFPNLFAHKGCVDAIGREEAVKCLREFYNEFKQAMKRFRSFVPKEMRVKDSD